MRIVKLIEPLDDSRRWWRVGAWEVDLNSTEVYPPNVRAAALAHRDGHDEEGRNVAAILAAQIEAGDTEPLPVVNGWLFAQSQRLVARINARIEEMRRAA